MRALVNSFTQALKNKEVKDHPMTLMRENFSKALQLRTTLAALFLSGLVLASGGVHAKNPNNNGNSNFVGSITYAITPKNPTPTDRITLSATFHAGGNGQPCTVSNISATIRGVTSNGVPNSGELHNPNNPTLKSTFSFPPFATGDLTPSFDYTTSRRSGGPCTGGTVTPKPEGGIDPPSVKPNPEPNVGILKSLVGPTSDFVPDEVVSYKIVVSNAGDATANGLTVTDQLSSHLLFVSASGAAPTPQVGSTGTVTWSLSLDPQEKREYIVSARVADDGFAGDVLNNANVSGSGQNKNSNDVQITVHRDPNVVLTKTINGPSESGVTLPAGSVVTYQVLYRNVGFGDANNVEITDAIPDEIIGTPLLQGGTSSSWDAVNRTASWNIGKLAAGDSSVVTVSGQIDPTLGAVNFDNQASVTWTGGNASSNFANIIVQPEPDFTISKVGDRSNASPGDRVHFSIGFDNIGSAAAFNTKVVDYLPDSVTPVAGSYGSAVYNSTDHTR